MGSRAVHTTMPSQDTTSSGGDRLVPAIRWVFPESKGRLSRLDHDTILLGRDDDCLISLPGNETSRKHAELRRDGPLHVVRDVGSRNGVFVDEGLTIRLPPLRERKEEIPFLFLHLLRLHAAGLPPAVEPRLVERLCLYDWPFNVREIDLLTRRLLVLHGSEQVLRRSHLPDQVLQPRSRDEALPAPSAPESHAERRRRELAALVQGLRAHAGNVARAAAVAGISRQRAYRLMEAERAEEVRDEP